MELHKRYFALVALILPTFATMALADDFADAREKINQAKLTSTTILFVLR